MHKQSIRLITRNYIRDILFGADIWLHLFKSCVRVCAHGLDRLIRDWSIKSLKKMNIHERDLDSNFNEKKKIK